MRTLRAPATLLLVVLGSGCASSDELSGGSGGSGGGGGNSEGTGTGMRPPEEGGGGSSASGFGGDGAGGEANCGPAEICGDGIDNDCNGSAEDGCDCAPGETRPCFSGDPDAAGVGLCSDGTELCDDTGKWSAICEGEVLPAEDECDGEDNDCDGMADEGFEPITCGAGECQVTVESCDDGVPNDCTPLDPVDAIEDCDGVDDDCDGTTDEGCVCTPGTTQPCYSGPPGTAGVGICAAGTQTCVNGQWGGCMGEVAPGTEVCNGVDEDCDSNTNEGACNLPNATSTCSGGGCVITGCSAGRANCDGQAANGCETVNTGSSNTAPGQDLGGYPADAFYGSGCGGGVCEGPITTQTGTRGRFFTIDALEASGCCSYVSMAFHLTVPPGMDYDLFITGDGCYADPGFSSENLAGVDEDIVVWCEDDCFGFDDSFEVNVEVRHYSGQSCEPWTLDVYRRGC